ncbi:hypothetical protein OPQ81_001542 [Rhizoctonia solani]|nr:hypothetical protein OPQ81_001542 [Rhizoctonia solani]
MPLHPLTSVVSIDGTTNDAQIPSCARAVDNHAGRLRDIYQAMNGARRIVVLCGAGISVHAGIPDFRTPTGLFQSLKREHPKENITSGRDLFDAAVFKSEETTALFYKMISHLATLSDAAQPTPFHDMLRGLDVRGQLLRVYTQNIDALEERAGLSFGVPTFPSRSRKRKAETSPTHKISSTQPRSSSSERSTAPSPTSHLYAPSETPSSSAQTSPRFDTSTYSPVTPLCTSPWHFEESVLSFETHSLAHNVPSSMELVAWSASVPGELLVFVQVSYYIMNRIGKAKLNVTNSGRKRRSGDDLLIVAGTSLRIPGAKRIVREFAKALHPNSYANSDDSVQTHQTAVKTVYLNLEFPVPAREWDGVFDFWVQGDVQTFARGFEKYRAEAERCPTNDRDPSIIFQSKANCPSKIRQTTTPNYGSVRSRRSSEESTSRSKASSVAKKSKHTTYSVHKSSGPPRDYVRAPHSADPGYQPPDCTSSQIKLVPEPVGARLKIKIKRPINVHTPDEPKLKSPPLPQEIHNPSIPPDTGANQRPMKMPPSPNIPTIAA